MSEQECYRFTMIEKRDRDGNTYLFSGLRILNCVLFIHKEAARPGEPQLWTAVLRPYTGGKEQSHEPR